MKKKLAAAAFTAAMAMTMGITAFAGEWKSNSTGWWWVDDDGTNPANEWRWLDGNGDGTFECYYFGSDGYMLSDTTTPDEYQVNADGAWIVNGGVQLQYNLDETADEDGTEAADDEDNTVYEYDSYDLIGTYVSEDGDYIELNIGEGDSLVGMYYDEDGGFENIYSFKKVAANEYSDSSRSRTIKFSGNGTLTMRDKVYTY